MVDVKLQVNSVQNVTKCIDTYNIYMIRQKIAISSNNPINNFDNRNYLDFFFRQNNKSGTLSRFSLILFIDLFVCTIKSGILRY